MCLIAFAYKVSPEYPLILVANREEFYDRPTEKAHFWKGTEKHRILAGKDLKAGGTWFGVSENGKWAAVTNHRDMKSIKETAPTRGNLIPDFLKTKETGKEYLLKLQDGAERYNGFNLLVGDSTGIYHYSNISDVITKIEPGIHGVSNALLNTPWPKLEKAKEMLKKKLQNEDLSKASLFDLLNDQSQAQEDELPNTGLSDELEKALSSIFIDTKNYGTRCSTLLIIGQNGNMKFVERTYDSKSPIQAADQEFEMRNVE